MTADPEPAAAAAHRTAARPVPAVRQYLLLVGASARALAQYRGDLIMMIVGGVLYQSVGLAFVWVVVARFGHVGGWSMGELAFLYGVRLTAHALWTIPGGALVSVDWILRRGEFDRYLIRPAGPLLQMLAGRFYPQPLGDLAGGIGVLAAAAALVPVDWSPAAVLYLAATVVGGAAVEVALQLGLGALSFRLLSTRALRIELIDTVMNSFGGYPLKIFPKAARFTMTFVVPLAFVGYLPVTVLLHRGHGLAVAPWVAAAAPAVGPLLLGLAYLVWRSQIRHYVSSGT